MFYYVATRYINKICLLNLRTPCTGVYVDMRSPSCSQVVRFSWERQIVMLLLDYTIRWNTAFLFSRHANRNGEHRVGTFSPARSVSGVIFNVLDQFNRTPDSIRFFIIFLFFVLYFFFFLFLSHSLLLLLSLSLSLSLWFLLEGETIYSTNATSWVIDSMWSGRMHVNAYFYRRQLLS